MNNHSLFVMWLQLGEVMLQRGSHKEALQNFELALRLDPKHRVSITPMVKKAGLDATDVSFYRPISNLPVLSKLLEPLVVRQVTEYLSSANLLPSLQSGFQPGHSTETAVMAVGHAAGCRPWLLSCADPPGSFCSF